MKKITPIVFFAIMICLFALIIMPADQQAAEKEHLSTMPELSLESVLSGNFTSSFETYLIDNIAFRSKFIPFATKIEDIRGIKEEASGRIVDLASGSKLVLNDGKIMEVYQANNESAENYIRVLNRYSQTFSDTSDIYLMLVPTQIEFDESQYRLLADSEKSTIDHIYNSVQNIKTVNVYDKLKAHIDEYIYFRTDHHWTQRGGYYGYESIIEAKGEKPIPLQEMTSHKYAGFLGYLYNQANVAEYSQYADEIEYFETGENYTIHISGVENGVPFAYDKTMYTLPAQGAQPTYAIFMDGDHPLTEINTNVKNGKVALIIKDSYANTVIPLLTNHYETILVIDPRSFHSTVSQLKQQYQIDDIIFINYALTTTFPSFIESVENIID